MKIAHYNVKYLLPNGASTTFFSETHCQTCHVTRTDNGWPDIYTYGTWYILTYKVVNFMYIHQVAKFKVVQSVS